MKIIDKTIVNVVLNFEKRQINANTIFIQQRQLKRNGKSI